MLRLKRRTPDHKGVFFADTGEKVEQVERMIRAAKVCGLDTETIGFHPNKESPVNKSQIFSIQFSTPDVHRIVVPNWGKYQENIGHLRKVLRNPGKDKFVLHNAKYDMHALANHKIRLGGFLADTMIMDFVFRSEDEHALKSCISRYFKEDTKDYREVFQEPKPLKRGGFSEKQKWLPPLDHIIKSPEGLAKLIDYGAKDPWYTVRLFTYLKKKLEAEEWIEGHSMLGYYETFEKPFTQVLFDVERRGCRLDREYLSELHSALEEDLTAQKREILRKCVNEGVSQDFLKKFNPKSGDQVGALFEIHLGCEIADRTPTGKPKTDDVALSKMRGPARKIADAILEWRKLSKIDGTYARPLMKFYDEYNGFVHTQLKHIGARSMRLSSATPNLQNQPTGWEYSVRDAFVQEEGCELGDIDLEQIEIRCMAHFSKDPVMVKAIREDWDLHALTATVTHPEVTEWVAGREVDAKLLKELKATFPRQRQEAKTLNFGIGYGMGPMKYSQMTGQSVQKGKQAIEYFYGMYKGLAQAIKLAVSQARKYGYVTTLLRKRLYIPHMNSELMAWRKAAERKCWNYKIQSSAGELLKMAMILIERDERLKSLGVKMTLQIHDELLFQIPKGAAKEAKPIIENYVSWPYRHEWVPGKKFKDLIVETPAKLGLGRTWMEAKAAA